jgi:uncharacterized cofD-like protein
VERLPRRPRLAVRIKRWIALLLFAIVLISLGAGYFLRALYSPEFRFPWWVQYLTLQFLSREARGVLFSTIGAALTVVALMGLSDALAASLVPHRAARVIDILHRERHSRRGPRVVAIGGGTGLSILLAGLKEYTGNLTAIVTAADDGGSPGILWREMDIPSPGDFRQCLAAVADVDPLMAKLLRFRFQRGSSLEGQSLGNLMIAAMAQMSGSFELGLQDMGRVLDIQGQVVPSTLDKVVLVAELIDKSFVVGESSLHERQGSAAQSAVERAPIERVFLKPAHAAAYPGAVRAILDADLIVVGPGSLYTSVLPNLLVKDILRAVRTAAAYKVFVCNVATEPGETDHFRMEDFLATVERNLGAQVFDAMVTNTRLDATRPPNWHHEVVETDQAWDAGVKIIAADVVDDNNAVCHDPAKLARVVMRAWADGSRHNGFSTLKRVAHSV